MALEIITNFLQVTDDMDLFTKINVEINNNAVKVMAKSIKETYDNLLKNNIQEKNAVITLSSQKFGGIDIKREYF